MSVSPEDALAALRPWIEKHKRSAWIPRTSNQELGPETSKFSGHPLLMTSEGWPICNSCNQPLELFLQLDLDTIPHDLNQQFGSGVLQLFYCVRTTSCEGGWEPFSAQCTLCRIVSRMQTEPAADNKNQFSPKAIIGWDQIVDYPNPSEHERLGLTIDYHFDAVPFQPMELRCPELALHFVGKEYIDIVEESVTSADGDKLGGWPNWIQGVEYPLCPDCGTEMACIMQIDSEDNVPFMFGDCGTGHITQCPIHKQIVAFGWACC